MPYAPEQIIVEHQEAQINQNKTVIAKTIDDITNELKLTNDKDNISFIFKELQNKIAKGEITLNLSCFRPRNNERMGYGKYPIYEDKDNNYPFSLWVFSFGDRQKTPIHDHKVDCLTSVISDKGIVEKTYEIKSEEERTVFRKKITKERRLKGSVKEDHLNENFVHRIKNPCKFNAVTMHMYYMTIENEGKWNSSVNKIYNKAPTCLDGIINFLKSKKENTHDIDTIKMLKNIKDSRRALDTLSEEQKISLKRQVDSLEKTLGHRARF